MASFVVCGLGGQKEGRGIETPSLLFYLWVLSVTRKYRPRQGFGKELDDNSYGRLAPFSYEFRKTTLFVFPSLPAHAAEAPHFCAVRNGGKTCPRGVPPLGYLPLWAVLYTQSVEAGRK